MKRLVSLLGLASALGAAAPAVMAQTSANTCPPVYYTQRNITATPDSVCPGQCTSLTYSAQIDSSTKKGTNAYRVDSIGYTDFGYGGGTPAGITVDDTWSPNITLPFSFCFFNNKYNAISVGANGQVTFNSQPASNPYDIPSIGAAPVNSVAINNSIFVWHDIYPSPSAGGSIYYNTYGTAPCRTFVVTWDSIGLFGCTSARSSFQIALHENTNVIDISIKRRDQCPTAASSWVPYTIVGIQNSTATNAYVPPGYNYASNNAYSVYGRSFRFSPISGTSYSPPTYLWRDMTGAQIGSGQSLTVCPTQETSYIGEAKMFYNCDTAIIRDTFTVYMKKSVKAEFTTDINFGCELDSVTAHNHSVGAVSNLWIWGDGASGYNDSAHVLHTYTSQGLYNITLIAQAAGCKDTITKQVDLRHPLEAIIKPDDDSVCQHTMITFNSNSVGMITTYNWDFGDGYTANGQIVQHTYDEPGLYNVKLIVRDTVGCYDTGYVQIIVDPTTFSDFTVTDSNFCVGKPITVRGVVSEPYDSITWNFGDGRTVKDRTPVTHTYDQPGIYTLRYSSFFRICDDTYQDKEITVKAYPQVDIGPDTVLCPGESTIYLSDRNAHSPAATYKWSTQVNTPGLAASSPDYYWLTVTEAGCSTTDTVWVKRGCYLDMPNSFTPNGDGLNDYFIPRQLQSMNVTAFKMQLFNRWGQKVFETSSTDGRGWDGKFNDIEQPTGAYIYLIDVRFRNGESEHFQGTVTLLR
jgi:gliding motility-associated-like protein